MQPLAQLPFIAGHPALDLVNTAEERGHPQSQDVLRSPADLRLWGRRYGLIGASTAPDENADGEFESAIAARELLYTLLLARVHRRPYPPDPLARLGQLAGDAYQAARLKPRLDGSVSWSWSRSELATIRHVAVTSAVELLRTEPTPRLKQCPGDHCGWFFIDTTKRGNRRWCSMNECGQDAKNRKRRKTWTP